MNRYRKSLLGIIIIVVLSLIGCNQTDVIHNESNVESSVETTHTSNSSEDEAPRPYTETITMDDVVGYWHGRLGNLIIFLYEGTSGEIQFLDNHGSAYLIFEKYSNEENGLVFDVNPASTGYENVNAFPITIFKVDGETLAVRIGEVTHEFKKINEDEFFEDQPMEYFGEVDIPAEEEPVLFLQDELMSLSDDEVEVGTLMNNYD
ncbi:hypothetical protein HF078_12530 [Bacillus sp. RO2]|uniref:hypothetical protein n=1 Tax=Bacillus sp. RO2 TaxID=2723913 RepID=UPI00145E7B50|nr:hypothetical protein [Bacillus sp. RO2]NMH73910.1 hypothetical protein [Bacillus sp. RO2]